ncbi:MAG: adenosine kinase [Bacteroidales bacterium]|nr:adenosine kinase [Bacteroidales bacterium]
MKKVLGIGNALVDIMTKLPNDDFLKKFGLEKGSMQLSEKEFAEKINSASSEFEKHQSSGGSAANTIHGLANLGVDTGYIGKVGNDEFGEYFSKDMQTNNIKPLLLKGKSDTGRAIALISPDSERTFATYLGAAIELNEDDIVNEQFKDYDILHIEGYLVQNHALLQNAAALARVNGLRISLDLASFNIVEDNIHFLKPYVDKYVDIVFANEEEAKAFTGEEPEKALDIISTMCDIAIVKIGKQGSLIKRRNEKFIVKAIKANAIDTTGAGDLYASGFLYGLVNELTLPKCGEIGSLLAGKVIEVIGSKLNDSTWNVIKKSI